MCHTQFVTPQERQRCYVTTTNHDTNRNLHVGVVARLVENAETAQSYALVARGVRPVDFAPAIAELAWCCLFAHDKENVLTCGVLEQNKVK